ncbi:SprT-like domain-containing protein [Madurella fahalii]|uniref:SprT-like domain-containing protein n=1 Tax=Madurella fahalii TaxID=1157608 RepID=A0ABQ0FXE3_9PEZI
MALPVAGGDEYPPIRRTGSPYYPAKRRTADIVDNDHHHHSRYKRPRYGQHSPYADHVAYKAADELPVLTHPPLYHPHPHLPYRYPSPHPHVPSPEPTSAATAATAAPAMERTASGHSILPDPTERCGSTELLEDDEAAQRVRDHLATFRRRNPDSKHERILRSIINPRRSYSTGRARDEYPLDNDALESIFSTANEIFFNGRLSQRVRWDWSHESSTRYDSRVIGTTALRRAGKSTRGFETLIVLSSTILRDERFSRRLLISTFLHELIHSYLFICCGFRARWCGGHTPGFRAIARIIDDWVGEESGLYLSRVEADLELFKIGGGEPAMGGDVDGGDCWPAGVDGHGMKGFATTVNVYPCSGMAADEHEYAAAAATTTATGMAGYGGHQEVAPYFGSRGTSSPGPAPGPQEPVQYYSDRRGGSSSSSSSGGSGNAWWRQRRAVRPLYVYSGDEPAASYVYANTNATVQRP